MIKLPRQNLKMKIKKKPGTLKREILDTKTTKSRQYLGEIKLRVPIVHVKSKEKKGFVIGNRRITSGNTLIFKLEAIGYFLIDFRRPKKRRKHMKTPNYRQAIRLTAYKWRPRARER